MLSVPADPSTSSAPRPIQSPHAEADRESAAEAIAWLEPAARHGARRLAVFELGLGEPVLVRLHHDVAGFVAACGQTDPWLRAWAGFATVDLLHPRFWRDATPERRSERLAHELTHCALYQAFGDERAARRARVPWWFSEGTASVVADQGGSRMPLALVRERAGQNPLDDDESLRRDHQVAYGAAHHAVAWLVAERGPSVLRRVLVAASEAQKRAPSAGRPLEAGLVEVTGLDTDGLWRAITGS